MRPWRIHHAPEPLPRSIRTSLGETHARLDAVAALEVAMAPWSGTLRRLMAARSISASTAIEGYAATEHETTRLLEGQTSQGTPAETRDAILDYRRAMDRVAGLAVDPEFQWRPSLIRDLHFLVTASSTRSQPGQWRQEEVYVHRGPATIPYQGPPAGDVPGLMTAASDHQASSEDDPLVRAALLHLHIVAVHPFIDGNGRTARVLHSLALARAHLLPLSVCSIESYLAEHTDEYYAALRTTNGVHRLGGPDYYDPGRSTFAWLEFCLHAHIASADSLFEAMETARRRARFCMDLARRQGLPDRMAPALDQALAGLPLSNESHRQRQNVAMPTATKDLTVLVDLGLLRRIGGGRSTRYEASPRLRGLWRKASATPR